MANGDRQPHLTATVLDQAFLDASHDNLMNDLRMVAEIETPAAAPDDKIYASNRNIYVGSTFYQALLNFPTIKRTIGDWLEPTIQFSTVKLELNNADGRFNRFLPEGADFDQFINREVTIKIGLRDVASTYRTIFRGNITEVGGISRSVVSVTFIARDRFDELNKQFPNTTLNQTDFPDLEDNLVGTIRPYILGDWRSEFNTEIGASVPSFPTNGSNANVLAGTSNLSLLISENDLVSFDTSNVYLLRSQVVTKFDSADIVNIGSGNKTFEIRQSGSGGVTTLTGGGFFIYKSGDKIFVRVQGKALASGTKDDNIVEQARDILITHGGAASGDFDANWDTFRDKTGTSAEEISPLKSRVWINKQRPAMTFALSLLEQVRLEAYISNDLKLKINSLHFGDMVANPAFIVRNWDVVKGSFSPKKDLRNNMNRIQGFFNRLPDIDDNRDSTNFFKNSAAITQANNKEITKGIVFPNMYDKAQVDAQVQEILKLTSASFETIDTELTWRSLLLDIGDFVNVDVKIGSSQFTSVPCMIRDIGYSPKGFKIQLKLWSMQMVPFPGHRDGSPGESPLPGTVGGYNATIMEEI